MPTMISSFQVRPESLDALSVIADVLAWSVLAAIGIWTLRQYFRPRRFIALPKTVDEPETDDHPETNDDLRNAA
ncbi:MAG: hypothetical protein JSR48_16080 [Verrucomicrobia bacterium]|nr:hypothetical protein [Verrucomicrobiota bacterium]